MSWDGGWPSGDGSTGGSSGGGSSPGGGFDWMGLLSGLLPGLGSLFGGSSVSNSLNQLQGSQSQLATQLMAMISGLNNDFSKYYQPAMGAESASVIGNLGATAGNIPLSDQVFAQEARTGLSPQVQQNAMNQLLQGFQSSLSDIDSSATPGSNTAAAKLQAQNQYLGQATNESANLANISQQYKNTGAQGLASNAFNALSAANAFTGQGVQLENGAMSGLDSLYSSMAQQAAAYAQSAASAPSPLSGIGSILGGIIPFL